MGLHARYLSQVLPGLINGKWMCLWIMAVQLHHPITKTWGQLGTVLVEWRRRESNVCIGDPLRSRTSAGDVCRQKNHIRNQETGADPPERWIISS